MRKRLAFVVGVLLLLIPAASTQDGIRVDATQITGAVSPFVYGANFGPLSVVPVDLFEQAENSGITFLRFPGGRVGDLNDLRPAQIDMYMRIVRLMGAEPSIHVRLENGTPEAAADLVHYTNIENDYDIRYWYVGNEPNLFDDYTVDVYVDEWRAIAEAMLAVDPDITLIGPEVSQWNGTPEVDPVDANGVDWLRGFLETNGDLVDVVAVHRYPFPRSQANPKTTIEDLRENVYEWGETVEKLREVTLEITGRDLPVAITEASSHWSANQYGEATPDSYYHAIWWADALGRLLQDNPFIIGYFELQTLENRGGWGILNRYDVRPTYYTYQLYQRFGTQMLHSESDVEMLQVYAALREDGALTLIAVNRGDEALSSPITIEGFEGSVTETRLLSEESMAEITEAGLLDGDMLTMPAQSAALIVLE